MITVSKAHIAFKETALWKSLTKYSIIMCSLKIHLLPIHP